MRPLLETAWPPSARPYTQRPAVIRRLPEAAANRIEVMRSAIAFAILLVIMFLEINLMPHRTTLTRVMRIRSCLGDEIGETLRQATGRDPTTLARRENGDGTIVHTMQMTIYRLEEQSLKDAVYAVDPEAVIDVLPLYLVWGDRRPTDRRR
ncbi:hypothetical protein [Paenibacillus sp. MBLB4367]|uniref:hypothetical protein n=1 Tax=Paenibacillus sp. MBLB4367 TaxID=3384767 RepID=UPI003908453C